MLFSFSSVVALAVLSLSPFASATEGMYSYDPASDVGPATNWATIDNVCDGENQSPIAINSSSTCTMRADYGLNAGTCSIDDLRFSVTKNGAKVRYPSEGCGVNTLEIPGVDGIFVAENILVHTSSEHTIDGELHGAEFQVVHKAIDAERYAIVSFMIDPTAARGNDFFDLLLSEWVKVPTKVDAACAMGSFLSDVRDVFISVQEAFQAFNVYDFVEGSAFYHYGGSWTTPPCSEVVWWNVAENPVRISVAQYQTLSTLIRNYRSLQSCELDTIASPSGSTSRPVQPLNMRQVDKICPTEADGGVFRTDIADTSIITPTGADPDHLTSASSSMFVVGSTAVAIAACAASTLAAMF